MEITLILYIYDIRRKYREANSINTGRRYVCHFFELGASKAWTIGWRACCTRRWICGMLDMLQFLLCMSFLCLHLLRPSPFSLQPFLLSALVSNTSWPSLSNMVCSRQYFIVQLQRHARHTPGWVTGGLLNITEIMLCHPALYRFLCMSINLVTMILFLLLYFSCHLRIFP